MEKFCGGPLWVRCYYFFIFFLTLNVRYNFVFEKKNNELRLKLNDDLLRWERIYCVIREFLEYTNQLWWFIDIFVVVLDKVCFNRQRVT